MKTRIGAVIEHADLPFAQAAARAGIAAKLGAEGVWLSQLPGHRETGTLLTGLALSTADVQLGTAIIPTSTRPPVVMAQTALTIDELCGGRLVLGLGAGHRMLGEWMLGGVHAATVGAMREYLTIVTDLIKDGEVNVTGRWFQGHTLYTGARRPDLPVFLGCFGPRMLELAAELADGVILWLCSPEYTREHVMPSLRAGWARRPGGHENFAVAVMIRAVLTPELGRAREDLRRTLNGYLRMPNYQKLMQASGFTDDVRAGRFSDAALDVLTASGSAARLQELVAAYREAGVTDVLVVPAGDAHHDSARFAATLEAAIDA
jgi:alkanesulfonate monooxygenase SsuD/methylene tetrahydromethanopterin reductase-like flavin-dependent oxidoreductase (luciferase family)